MLHVLRALQAGQGQVQVAAAHLGGAIAGAYFIRHTHLLRDFFDFFGNAKAGRKKKGAAGKAGGKKKQPRSSRREAIDEAEVDRILSKVGTQGLHSLTDKEKRVLRRATESKN